MSWHSAFSLHTSLPQVTGRIQDLQKRDVEKALAIKDAGLAFVMIPYTEEETLTAKQLAFLLGGGILVLGCVSFIAGLAVHYHQVNVALTIYNVGMCLVGLLNAAAGAAARFEIRSAVDRPRLFIGTFYSLLLAAIGGLAFADINGMTPAFYVEGHGVTYLRQIVLSVAVATFALGGASVSISVRVRRFHFRLVVWLGDGFVCSRAVLLAFRRYCKLPSLARSDFAISWRRLCPTGDAGRGPSRR